MELVNSIFSFLNYETKKVTQKAHQIATNPSAVKKTFQIVGKLFATVDLSYGNEVLKRPITEAMKGTTDSIEFYGSFKNIMFWINPFSKESLDQTILLDSLKSSLSASHTDPIEIKKQQKRAKGVFRDVMVEKDFNSKGEVLESIRGSLENHGYTSPKAQQIAERVFIQQKSRPALVVLSMVCFTVADLGSNLMTLKKWGILDLSKLAAQIGGQSRIFLFVFKLGAETVLGTVASVALIFAASDASYRIYVNTRKYYYAKANPILALPGEKEEAYKGLRNATLDLISSGVDLVSAATPLLFTLNPPVVVALAIIAKGTGLICILVR